MKNLKLTRREQKVFDAHQHLVPPSVRKLKARYPWADHGELSNIALTGLARAAKQFDPQKGVPFIPYARRLVEWECRYFLFGGHAGNRSFWRTFQTTCSLSEPVDEERTRADLVEEKYGDAELQSDLPSENLAARLNEIRQAIQTVALSADEKRFLRFRYVLGIPMKTLARRMGRSAPWLKRVHRSAVRKLRAALPGALPPTAPLPADGNPDGCPGPRPRT